MTPLGKWHLHRFFSKDPEIRKHLPPTALFNDRTLKLFLEKYGAVYLKPDHTHRGQGIIKAWATDDGYALVFLRGDPTVCSSLDELYKEIKRRALAGRYVIQKAIPLARIGGRPFDVRVMMMRNVRYRWQFFGLYSKVAGPRSIVTNISNSRGYVLPFEKSMKLSLGLTGESAANVKSRLVRLSHKICKRAGRIKYYQKIGNDFAVDENGKVWIIEVNFTYPGFKGFARLPDRKYYRRIKRMNRILQKRAFRRKKRSA